MPWTVHGERVLYDSPWVRLAPADVELPDGRRYEHHVVRVPYESAGVVVRDPDRGMLLLWRHRFVTDAWGWEIPAGMVDAGETPAEAAAREALEETGWRPGPLRPLGRFDPNSGLNDGVFHLFVASGATEVGPPADLTEAERVEWLTLARVRAVIAGGRMRDGPSLLGVLWALASE